MNLGYTQLAGISCWQCHVREWSIFLLPALHTQRRNKGIHEMSDFSVTLQPPALAAFFHHRWRDWRIFCAISRRLRRGNFGRQCAFVFALYFFGILGLLLADVYYADDQFRAVTAQPNFLFSGRYIAEYGSSALSMQKWGVVLDWSPISQLLAIAILALGSVALARVVTGSRKTDYATETLHRSHPPACHGDSRQTR